MEATESYGRQRVGAPSTLHKSVRREAGFPPRSQGGDQSYPNVNIMLVVSAVSRAAAVSSQSIICRATDESPGKISLSTRQPAQSAVLICERRAVSKNFINFCCALDSNRYQHHNIWPKAVTKASHKGYWWALCPCRPSSNCSHQSC